MARKRRTAIPFLGALTTALLHSLLLTSVVWNGGTSTSPRPPEKVGSAANSGSPAGSSSERLILIELSAVSVADVAPARPLLAELASTPNLLKVMGPDSLPLQPLFSDENGESTASQPADVIARTQLIGLYEGQIRARIERAWIRPRTPLADRLFRCRVRIWQDEHGNVRDVRLQECEGTPDWFESMVTAIKAASPLPAPPNPAVFADTFEMSFQRAGSDPRVVSGL